MATEIAVLVGGRISPHANIIRGLHSFQVMIRMFVRSSHRLRLEVGGVLVEVFDQACSFPGFSVVPTVSISLWFVSCVIVLGL